MLCRHLALNAFDKQSFAKTVVIFFKSDSSRDPTALRFASCLGGSSAEPPSRFILLEMNVTFGGYVLSDVPVILVDVF